MSVADEAKRLYEQYVPKDDLERINALSYPDQVYFWTVLYYEMPRRIGRAVLGDMERDVAAGRARMRATIKRVADDKMRRLDEMWDTTKPHSWFKTIVR